MLETIREYALERLEAGATESSEGEAQKVHDFHAEYYLALAEAADPQITGAEQKLWLERLEREHDNLRAALGWAFEQADAEMAGRLGGSLWKFWEVHSHFKEGSRWLQQILEQFPDLPTALRARLLNGAGVLALAQNDYSHATAMLEESLALQRELADKLGVSSSLNNLGMIAVRQGDFEQAALLLGESLSISRELGDNRRVSTLLINLGAVYLYTERFEEVEPALEESLALSRELGDNWAIALALGNLAEVARHLGQSGRARTLYAEVVEQLRELGDKAGVAQCLVGLAQVELDEGNPKRAVALLGAAESIRIATGAAMSPTDTAEADSFANVAREQLGAEAFAEAWAEGHAMSFEQAIRYALE
jgi:tetratricopeptide (TPR) repeat protein